MNLGKVKMRKKSMEKTKTEKSLLMCILSGIGAAYAVTCIVFIGYALMLTYTGITEKYIPLVVILTSVISVLIAGFDASKGAKQKGWLWGMVAGLVYIVVLFLIGVFATRDFGIGTNMITLILISVAGGGLGGIFGINVKRR